MKACADLRTPVIATDRSYTMAIVLDASVVLAWLLPDERSDAAERLLARAVREQLRAPSLLLVEVANALLQAERRERLRRSVRLELFDAFTSLPMVVEPIAAEATGRALELATLESLTVYDACCLELALARDCALATFDEALGQAARARGVPVLDA